jgi:hypothetical protein
MGCGADLLPGAASWSGACAHLSLSFLPFPFFVHTARRGLCRLRHSSPEERRFVYTVLWTTERSGSAQEVRVWVKRSRSIKRFSSGMLEKDGSLVRRPGEADRSFRDASRRETKAASPQRRNRIAVERRCKPLTSVMGYLTHAPFSIRFQLLSCHISVTFGIEATRNCDFTQFSAASAPIILPCETPFQHEAGNYIEGISLPLPPYRCHEFKKEV